MDEPQLPEFSYSAIRRYLEGSMSPREMHELERAALQDPFLADAIAGYVAADPEKTKIDLKKIHAKLSAKDSGIIPLIPWYRKTGLKKIAAIFILLAGFGAAGWLIWFRPWQSEPEELAGNLPALTTHSDTTKDLFSKSTGTSQSDAASEKLPAQAFASGKHGKEPVDSARQLAAGNTEKSSVTALSLPAPPTEKTNTSLPEDTLRSQASQPAYTNRIANLSMVKHSPDTTASILSNQEFTRLSGGVSGIEIDLRTNKSYYRYKDSLVYRTVPEGGWESFRDYVYKKLKKNPDSTDKFAQGDLLNLEFSLDDNGRPYDFNLLRFSDSASAKAAIEAIRDGPKWIRTTREPYSRIILKF